MTSIERQFLSELTAISAKYGIKIYGCGCCGSPLLQKMDPAENVPEAGYASDPKAEGMGGPPGGVSDIIWVSPQTRPCDRGHGREPVVAPTSHPQTTASV